MVNYNQFLVFDGEVDSRNLYKSVQDTYFKINGIVLSDSKAICDIIFDIVEKNNDGDIIVKCKVSDITNTGGIEELRQMVNFVNKIESVSKELIIAINKDGIVYKLLNKENLKQKWDNLKNELKDDSIFKNIPAESQKLILQQGEIDFSDSSQYHKEIKNSMIYYNLIYPFYGKVLNKEKNETNYFTERNSSIIKQAKILLENTADFFELEDGTNEIRVVSKNKENENLGVLESELKKNYPQFPGTIKKYNYTISHTYKLEKKSNKIISSTILMQEKIDDVFEVVLEHKLNLLDNE